MELSLVTPKPTRISVSPPGRGWRARPEVQVNADYVRTLLEQSRLTERDEMLLRWLDELPLLSSRQIKRLFWPDTTASNMHRRLRALYDYHLLDRVRMLNKTEGITYCLGKAGRLWLHGDAGRGGSPPRVNLNQLAHDLAVAEVAMMFVRDLRYRDPGGERMQVHWQGEHRSRIIHQDRVILEPDAQVRVTLTQLAQYQLFFVEVDMGTERAAAIEAKIKRYHHAHRLRLLVDINGHVPFVLVTAPTDDRVQALAEIIAAANSPLTWVLNPLPLLTQYGVYNKPWTVVSGSEISAGNLTKFKTS